jgi:phosphoglycolate phosphatase
MTPILIFDFDDTLVTTFESRASALIELGNTLGITVTEDTVKAHWGKPFYEFMYSLFEKSNISVEEIILRYEKSFEDFPLKLYDDAKLLINEAVNKNCYLGIVSSSSMSVIKKGLAQVELESSMFSYIQGSDSAPYHKPDPRCLEVARSYFENLGVVSSNIIYIGDSIIDYYSAKGAGLRFIPIARDEVRFKAFNQAGITPVKSLCQIVEFLEIA